MSLGCVQPIIVFVIGKVSYFLVVLLQIALADGLIDSLNLMKIGEYELARVTGIPTRHELKPATTHEVEPNPTLVGDVKLAEFRQVLLQNGFAVRTS